MQTISDSPIRILCAVNGAFSSHVARVLAVALELRPYPEFQIVFSGSGPFMAMPRRYGFEIIETDHLTQHEVFATTDSTGIHWYDDPARLEELFHAEQTTFETWRPDVCVRDAFRDPASVVARLSNVMDIMVIQANETSAFEFDFVPTNYDLGGTREEMTNLNQLVRIARHKVYQPIYRKAVELGLPSDQCQDFGCMADLYFVSDSFAVYPMKTVPMNYFYVGPLIHAEPGVSPSWLDEFSSSPRVKILITGGSTNMVDFAEFFRAVDPDRRIYTLACTDRASAPDFSCGPESLTAVLPHADLFVTHGGLGSTYVGMVAAKPMIVLYDQFERQANAHRLAKLGVGAGFDSATVTPDEFIAATKRLLGDSGVRTQLVKVREQLLAEPTGAPRAAARLVAECINRFPQAADRLRPVLAQLRDSSDRRRLGNEEWVAAMTKSESSRLGHPQRAATEPVSGSPSQVPVQPVEKVISVDGMRKTYGSLTAVDEVSFTVRRGEVFGLLGPNGAGKSTTIEVLTGNRCRDAGMVSVLGLDPSTQPDLLKQRIGVQLQDVRLFKNLTVRETLELFASFYTKSRSVDEVIELVGLTDKAGTRVKRLSGGQNQRVGIAASMIGRGEILFMDEPTAGLDPKNRRLLMDAIRGIRGEETTVFLTTHFMDEAQSLCDRVAIIDNGRLIALDTPDRLIAEHCPETVVRIERQPGFTAEVEAEISALSDTKILNEGLVCYCENVVSFIGGLATILARHDLDLANVAIHQATLEDVFLKLTGRKVEQE